jgi:putative adhesin
VILNGGSIVEGNIGNRVKPLNMPPVDPSGAAASNNNANLPLLPRGNRMVSPLDRQRDFVLNSGDVYTLPAGTYYFNNMRMEGGATLNITGNTTIVLTGDLTRAGGAWVNNNTALASNLEIYMTGGKANITSDNTFYGVIYAPNTDVTVNASADFFGAVVGKTLKVSGSGRGHYDEALDLEQVDPPTRTTIVD